MMPRPHKVAALGALFCYFAAIFVVYTALVGNTFGQGLVIMGGILGYVVWGFWVHYAEDRLRTQVIYEYLSLAALLGLLYTVHQFFY